MPRVLVIADITGRPGRRMVSEHLPALVGRFNIDLVVANAENAAAGFGITPALAQELLAAGVDCLTMGNHVWDKKELQDYIEVEPRIIRPANFPPGTPGRGSLIVEKAGVKIAVINLLGRVFMAPVDCPFQAAIREVEAATAVTPMIIVDMHAEATSEKQAMGYFLDGKVSAVLGTHTHVATADARLLPGGTAYMTDIGMTGPVESVIGISKELIIQRFLTHMPTRFEVAGGPAQLQGAVVEIDPQGRAQSIEPVRVCSES